MDEDISKRTNRFERNRGREWEIDNKILTSIRRWFFSISLDFHSSCDSCVGFSSWKISHVNEGVIECCHDVADSENILSGFSNSSLWRSVVSYLFFLFDLLISFSSFGSFGSSSFLLCLWLNKTLECYLKIITIYLLIRYIE